MKVLDSNQDLNKDDSCFIFTHVSVVF
jgi:hypothetical protein